MVDHNPKVGDLVLLRSNEHVPNQQMAEVLEIDKEVITFCVRSYDRQEDDADGLVEGSVEDIVQAVDRG